MAEITYTFNTTLEAVSFEPFFNISNRFLFAWTVVNYLKSFYVAMSIHNRRLPPVIIASIYAVFTAAYFVKTRDFTYILLQLLDLFVIIHAILTTRDNIFLLALLSFASYFLQPFAFIVDVFTVLFLLMDYPILFVENTYSWGILYLNCLFFSTMMAVWNSYGPALYKFFLSCVVLGAVWLMSCTATNTMRAIPVFVANVAIVLSQFNRQLPIRYPEFSRISSIVIKFN